MQLTAGETPGAYRIAGLIGAGGMGEVYRGRDIRRDADGRLLVIKTPTTGDEPIRVVVNWDRTCLSGWPGASEEFSPVDDLG